MLAILLASSGIRAAVAAPDADELPAPEIQTESTMDGSEIFPAPPAGTREIPLADAVTAANRIARTFDILGTEISPGTYQRLSWSATELFEGLPVSTPVLAARPIDAHGR